MFRLVKILNGRTNQGEPVRLPTGSRTYEIGEALLLDAGEAVQCGDDEKPEFICCEDKTFKSSTGNTILAMPISPDMIFEVPVSESPEALIPGVKVTLCDCVGVTATTENGVATVVSTCGATSAGDKIQVCFK